MSESEVNTFLEINGWKIYFERIGSGPNTILLIPGAIGTGRTDFEELLEGEDELDYDKFTVVAVEAAGWGRSRPPARQYGTNTYNNDCQCFHGVMEGARIALLMATKYRNSVVSLVLLGLKNLITPKGLSALFATKSVDKWNEDKLNSYLKVYETKEEIQRLWNRFLKFAEFYHQYFPENIFKDKYKLVRCPVLITHGDRDAFVEAEQAIENCNLLRDARLHRFPLGDHESHRKYATQFKKLVQDHILEQNNSCKEDETDQFMNQLINNNIMA